jgi:hypothetical protein
MESFIGTPIGGCTVWRGEADLFSAPHDEQSIAARSVRGKHAALTVLPSAR